MNHGGSTAPATVPRTPAPTYRVLATCGFFAPGFRAGGPIRSVMSMLDTLAPDVRLALVTSDRDFGCRQPYPGLSGRWRTWSRCRVFYLNRRSLPQWFRLWRAQRAAGPYDLLYLNSAWDPVFSILPVLATVLGLVSAQRILIAPRGEFSAGALGIRGRKKRLFLAVWRRVLRRRDVLWHATNHSEAASIRALIPDAEIVLRANDTLLPAEPLPPVDHGDSRLRLVFISRISPMKNLDLALRSMASVTRPLIFDIYGPVDDRSHWKECQRLIGNLPATVTVSYHGPLDPAEVPTTFARYDAFVLPTRGENFGHVIAESLSASCPVVCSAQTPWTDVLRHGGGVVLPELSEAELGRVIEAMAATDASERYARRTAAGAAFRGWRRRPPEPGVIELVRSGSVLSPSGPPSGRPAVRTAGTGGRGV
ncbi:glycosyltransferase [Micromonospora sp. FIMYZ51]|uniref:glycosyltransferase family 4 protein n=1 Tax=Micromonospora sp. FIMYZ51 TaxID=3051832 RepID=UPI00311FA6C7